MDIWHRNRLELGISLLLWVLVHFEGLVVAMDWVRSTECGDCDWNVSCDWDYSMAIEEEAIEGAAI